MDARSAPPFRADHVGSLLRPKELLEARERRQHGLVSAAELRQAEDCSIRDAVRLQEDLGFRGVTDGEHRRTYFHIDFLEQLEGIAVRGGLTTRFHGARGDVDFAPPRLEVTEKLRRTRPIQLEDFRYLQSVARAMPKVCIPSPTMVHFRGGREAISREAYPDLEQFFEDLARCYREEIADLAAAGCRYLQLDDTNLAYLCDPKLREGAKERGDDPDQLPHRYARLINAALRGRPANMAVCVHLCRGNFKSAWVAEGGYEPVADALFNELEVDGYFLEYDDHRSGDFSPLRFIPRGKKVVVLGLITSKVGTLEPKAELVRRIRDASRYVPLEQLAVSPQCGFSSTVHGNQVTSEEQRAKLRLVVETATEVWGKL
jgi:5-methyltetrahydropteroyltriglutamate--homocysteine methyltransferase